jgi:hypothetical protein
MGGISPISRATNKRRLKNRFACLVLSGLVLLRASLVGLGFSFAYRFLFGFRFSGNVSLVISESLL